MKKLKFLLAILVAVQFSFAQEIDFGLKLGANFSNFNDASSFDSKTGFVGGAFAAAQFSSFGLQTELLYSQQGAEFNALDFDLDYVNVPVLFKYYVIGGLNIQLGPQFGFLIDDTIPDASFETEDFDLSGVTGLGIDLPLGIRADARYIFGLNDIFKNSDGKTGVFTLSLGYSFL